MGGSNVKISAFVDDLLFSVTSPRFRIYKKLARDLQVDIQPAQVKKIVGNTQSVN